MIDNILLYIGSGLIILWGVAHILPTRSVISGFGTISVDNKRIITMEWLTAGLTMCFIGVLILVVTFSTKPDNAVAIIVYRISAIMLLVMTGLSLLTGARTSIIPMKICPAVTTIVAILYFLGSII